MDIIFRRYVKGDLLHNKRSPFTKQDITFWSVKDKLLQNLDSQDGY